MKEYELFSEVLRHLNQKPTEVRNASVVSTDLRQVNGRWVFRALMEVNPHEHTGYYIVTLEQGNDNSLEQKGVAWLDAPSAGSLLKNDVGMFVWCGGDRRPLGLTALYTNGKFVSFKEKNGRVSINEVKEDGFNTRPLDLNPQIKQLFAVKAYCENGNFLATVGYETEDIGGPIYFALWDHLGKSIAYEESWVSQTGFLDIFNGFNVKALNRFGNMYLVAGGKADADKTVSPWFKLVDPYFIERK